MANSGNRETTLASSACPSEEMAPTAAKEDGRSLEEEDAHVSEASTGGGDEEGEESPLHLPLAPSSELFDVCTTVDPSYIISLIRKILPHDKATDNGSEIKFEEKEKDHLFDHSEEHRSVADTWEECGCILWDLSVEKDHATFMVDNLLLDVLLANLSISNSSRITEICLGIIGNLACHENLATTLISQMGLVETAVNHLFQDDGACLLETCRLLTVSLRGSGSASWIKALQPEPALERILWIAENTLNLQLLEKTIELLLTIADDQEASTILLPPLNKLGLPTLLPNLLECEMRKVMDENKAERISVIDLILQTIESLSAVDSYSRVISSNEQFLGLLFGIVKLPDKIEVSVLCPTAAVIIANILTDETCLASKFSQDQHFLEGLLDLFPFVSTDPQARNALWSILGRLLSHVQADSNSDPKQHVSVLVDKAYLIEEDLDGHPGQGSDEGSKCGDAAGEDLNLTIPALRRIATLLNCWMLEAPSSSTIDNDTFSKADRLLGYCLKFAT